MRRSTSRIGKLPGEVLEQVNEKLYASWEYREIRKCLFEEVAVEDVPALGLARGEKFGLVWLRSGKSTEHAYHHCELALGNWFRSWHAVWVREKLRRGDSMRIVRKANALTRQAAALEDRESTRMDTNVATEKEAISIEGGDVLMRSVLIDAISGVEEGGKDRREIAQLANAWARLNQGDVEEKKLKLKTQSAFELACEGLGKEIKDIPEALELFYKLRDVVARSKKKADPLGN